MVVASIVTVAVAGNLFTVVGDTVQKLPPANEQDKAIVPENPSCAVMLIGPLAFVPALIMGNCASCVMTKSGFVVTVRLNGCVFGPGAPDVVAEIETVVVPTGVE
jgi:hypothetical protein